MRYITTILLITLVGCSSSPMRQDPDATLVVDKEVQPMSRNMVILSIKECETSGLRAVLLTSKRKVNGYSSDIVVDVTCMPKY